MKPVHPSTSKFAKQKLFKDVKSLDDALSRIGKLPNSTEIGDAWEVVCEWYHVVIKKASEYHTSHNIPASLRKKYRFPTGAKDAGIDAIFKNENGDYVAIQAKHRNRNQESISWGELGTFFGASEELPQRCVFTSTPKITKRISNKKRYYTIRRHDLNALSEERWSTLRPWTEGKAIKPTPLNPRDYQIEAVDNICKTLKEHDRCQAIMACATGKTIIGIDALKCTNAVSAVLWFPSLALLRQTQREMMKYYYQPDMKFISVCSDFSITKGIDELNFDACDSEFPVTTNVEELKKLIKGSKKIIIFSTYQSSNVVAEACKGRKFDMGIFDEAHKTTGRRGSNFALPLFDSNIKISKRLFLTATPRDIAGDDSEIMSMDDVPVYGPVAYHLPFSEAIDRGIICPYKVIATVITSDEVDRFLLKRGEVRVKGGYVRGVHVAHQLALEKAAERYKIKKIFSFHNTIAAAQAFVSDGAEGIGSHIKGLECFHVNGGQRADEREDTLEEFSSAKRAILSNSKCLTEGIDVPEVDCVAFIQPRKSTIDIVQAVGRAMRKHKSKTCGYLFVPIYIEQNEDETAAQAIERTGYTRLVEVIQAMALHDNTLQELLTIAGEQIHRGGLLGSTQRAFEDFFDVINESVLLDVLKENISVRLVRDLIPTWDEYYYQLIDFKEEHGHCDVPQNGHKNHKDNPQLSHWYNKQRYDYNRGILSKDKIRKLDLVGVDWSNARERTNVKNIEKLEDFYKKHGHCGIEFCKDHDPNDSFSSWLSRIRSAKKKSGWIKKWVDRLNKINFCWSPLSDQRWEKGFATLLKFKEKHGHVNPPANCKILLPYYKTQRDGSRAKVKLTTWCQVQRMDSRNPQAMLINRADRLNEIGFYWWQDDATWISLYEELKKGIKPATTNFRPRRCGSDGLGIDLPKRQRAWVSMTCKWIRENKPLHGSSIITREAQKKMFEDIGIVVGSIGQSKQDMSHNLWMTRYEVVKDHKEKTDSFPEWKKGDKFAKMITNWMTNQRKYYREGTLDDERIKLLNEIEFPWKSQLTHKPKKKLKIYALRSKPNLRTNKPNSYVSYVIRFGSEGGKAVSFSSSKKERAEEALPMFQKKLDEGWSKSLQELKELAQK